MLDCWPFERGGFFNCSVSEIEYDAGEGFTVRVVWPRDCGLKAMDRVRK
jgi:hypothetical protein